MQTKRNRFLLLAVMAGVAMLIVGSPAATGAGDEFSVSWYTDDGGGGASAAGDFAIVGTAGQADLGGMSGGDFAVAAGYWGAPLQPVLLYDFVNQLPMMLKP